MRTWWRERLSTAQQGVLIAFAFTVAISVGIGEFIGIGLTLVSFSIGPFFVGALYIIFYMLTLPPELTAYKIKMYDLDPSHSEVIQRLASIFNVYLYMVAGYMTIGNIISSLNPVTYWWIWGSVIIGWLPTISQFFINQYFIRKIIVNAKWTVLNQFQEQIVDLQTRKIRKSPEIAIKQINELMDLHDRINAKPNSMFNLNTGISFLNQLMLPLLGLLLANFDKMLKLIKP